ncbi:MAG: early nodulin 20 (N-20) [Clostridiales bacterium]|nr:early nodulin 20 (N-20) [Clostridiales bacterium]
MSKKALKLHNPIAINGKQVTELTYDPTEITALQFSEACARSAAIEKSKTFSFKLKENDYSLHLYLGMMAVIAVNPDIDISDLERIRGFDTLELTDIGMLFTLRRLEAPSEENNSGEQSENTPELSIQASET